MHAHSPCVLRNVAGSCDVFRVNTKSHECGRDDGARTGSGLGGPSWPLLETLEQAVFDVEMSIIQPPFRLLFREMTKPELNGYFDWFAEVTPPRIAVARSGGAPFTGARDVASGLSPPQQEALDLINEAGGTNPRAEGPHEA